MIVRSYLQSSTQIYLVPCLLKLKGPPQDAGPIPSIHFKFMTKNQAQFPVTSVWHHYRSAFLPRGLFHRLICSCIGERIWSHHLDKIYYDYMSFDCGHFCFSLRMAHVGVTLSARFKSDQDSGEHSEKLSEIRKLVQEKMEDITKARLPEPWLCRVPPVPVQPGFW